MQGTGIDHRRVREVLLAKGHGVFSVAPNTTVSEVVRLMSRHNIGSVVISYDAVEPIGVFSERDVLTRVIDAGLDPVFTLVREVMDGGVSSVTPETRLSDAMRLMTERRVRHLPVVQNSQMVGLVSIGDINKAITEALEQEVEYLGEYISGSYQAVS